MEDGSTLRSRVPIRSDRYPGIQFFLADLHLGEGTKDTRGGPNPTTWIYIPRRGEGQESNGYFRSNRSERSADALPEKGSEGESLDLPKASSIAVASRDEAPCASIGALKSADRLNLSFFIEYLWVPDGELMLGNPL